MVSRVHPTLAASGRRVDRPSFRVGVGDEISVKDKSKGKSFILEALEASTARIRPGYLEFDPAKCEGKLIDAPDRTDLPFDLNEQAIIEFYSQKL